MRREANKQIILQANYAGDGESDVWTAGLMMVMVIKIMILMMIVINKC